MISGLRERLARERFSQIPQLEPADTRGPLFHRSTPAMVAGNEAAAERAGGADRQQGDMLSLLQRIVQLLESHTVAPAARRLLESERQLVYVHGICRHERGYSDPWWAALRPHLSTVFRGKLEANRHEVLWSEIVSRRKAFEGVSASIQAPEQKALADSILAILQDRAERQATDHLLAQADADRTTEARDVVDFVARGIPGGGLLE